MSAFGDQVRRFGVKISARQHAAFVNIASAVKASITDGSPLTGAPGQPVQTGRLKNSYTLRFESSSVAEITTNVPYAKPIEDGIGPHGALTLRSEVGGFHSVALTLAGVQNIANDEAAKLQGGGGA